MATLIQIVVTEDEALDMRMALSAAAIAWGEKARAYREFGSKIDAATCERIRAGYNALWEKVEKAQGEASAVVRNGMSAVELRATVNTLGAYLATGNRAARRRAASRKPRLWSDTVRDPLDDGDNLGESPDY